MSQPLATSDGGCVAAPTHEPGGASSRDRTGVSLKCPGGAYTTVKLDGLTGIIPNCAEKVCKSKYALGSW